MDKKNHENVTEKNSEKSLDEKVGMLDRLKYVALPAVFAVGAYFIPEIKGKYNRLSSEKKDTCDKLMLVSSGIFGATITAYSGYKLYKQYEEDKKKQQYVLQV
ncbi:MAG: hypothetical protein ACP5N1_06965 [Candidatus Woesearchaeota archaeon]